MSQRPTRRHRRRPLRTALILCFVAAALIGTYYGFFRRPELPPEPADTSAAQGGEAVSAAASEPSRLERKTDFYTILVSGVDDGNGNSDTNILVAFDAGTGAAHCVSIPRDTGVNVSRRVNKINAAYGSGGMEQMASEVSQMLGIPVDFTVEVDLRGFVKLVDAVGGVDFDVPINMNYDDPYQDLSIHFNKGLQHLTGKDALKVVRFRHNNDGTGYGTEDLGRIGTQQAFLKAVAKQTLQFSNLDKMGEFAQIFQDYVETDLTVGNLAWLGKEAVSMGTEAISFSTLPGEWSSRRSVYLLDGEAVLELVNASLNPYVLDRTAEELDLLT